MENIDDSLKEMREKIKPIHFTKAIWNNLKAFSLRNVPKEEIEKEISDLDDTKASQQSDIPTNIIKMNVGIFC